MRKPVILFSFLTVIMTGCVTINMATNGDNSVSNRGEWTVNGQAGFVGSLDFTNNADSQEQVFPSINFKDVNGDIYNNLFGNLDLIYRKPVTAGAVSAVVGVDYFRGLGASVLWDRKFGNDNFTAYLNFNRDSSWPENWPAIIIGSSYDTGWMGIEVAAYNTYWSEMALSDFRLLQLRRQPPDLNNPNYNSNRGLNIDALNIYEMDGYYQAFNNQFRMDLCYKQRAWKEYRDYFRASDIVARNWNSGDQSVGVTYKPDFLSKNLVAGISVTEIGLDINTVTGSTTENYAIKGDPKANPPRYGALNRTIIGVKYDTPDLAFSAMINMGDTGGSSWWFLNKDANDKDMEDGYFDLVGSDPYSGVRSFTGFNAGARANITDTISVNGDAEVVGLSDMAKQGMMAAGAMGSYTPIVDVLETDLTVRMFYWLGSPQYGAPGGLIGIHPSVTYTIMPNVLRTSLRLDFLKGMGGDLMSQFNFVKINPKIFWTVNGDSRGTMELGYVYRYDFNPHYSEAKENSVQVKFGWKF